MEDSLSEELSKLSDKELVERLGSIGDPDYREMVLAEERRRGAARAVLQAKRSNLIALGSLVIALVSLVISIFAASE